MVLVLVVAHDGVEGIEDEDADAPSHYGFACHGKHLVACIEFAACGYIARCVAMVAMPYAVVHIDRAALVLLALRSVGGAFGAQGELIRLASCREVDLGLIETVVFPRTVAVG